MPDLEIMMRNEWAISGDADPARVGRLIVEEEFRKLVAAITDRIEAEGYSVNVDFKHASGEVG